MERSRASKKGFDWSSIRHWDLFPKFDADVVVQSKAGGCVTIIALICVSLLFMSETYYYFGEQRMDTIIVDDSLSVPFPIYFDIIFPFLDCSLTVVDVVDDEDHPIPVLAHDIRKHRIGLGADALFNAQLSTAREAQDPSTRRATTGVKDLDAKGYGNVQQSCMACEEGSFFSIERCCDCNSVKQYYLSTDEPEAYTTHPLCIRDHTKELRQAMVESTQLKQQEGCRVRGHITVPRLRGNLHIAAMYSQMRAMSRAAGETGGISNNEELNAKFRAQHVIRELRFGDAFDGQANPLTGYELYNPGLLRHIYLIKLVPTRYEGGWIPIESYQYAFAPHTEKVDTSKAHWHLPGVYFRYEFTPMMALISTRYSHLSTYITRVFALVGGLWVVLGVIYRMSNKVVGQVNTKKNQ